MVMIFARITKIGPATKSSNTALVSLACWDWFAKSPYETAEYIKNPEISTIPIITEEDRDFRYERFSRTCHLANVEL